MLYRWHLRCLFHNIEYISNFSLAFGYQISNTIQRHNFITFSIESVGDASLLSTVNSLIVVMSIHKYLHSYFLSGNLSTLFISNSISIANYLFNCNWISLRMTKRGAKICDNCCRICQLNNYQCGFSDLSPTLNIKNKNSKNLNNLFIHTMHVNSRNIHTFRLLFSLRTINFYLFI